MIISDRSGLNSKACQSLVSACCCLSVSLACTCLVSGPLRRGIDGICSGSIGCSCWISPFEKLQNNIFICSGSIGCSCWISPFEKLQNNIFAEQLAEDNQQNCRPFLNILMRICPPCETGSPNWPPAMLSKPSVDRAVQLNLLSPEHGSSAIGGCQLCTHEDEHRTSCAILPSWHQ